MKRLFLLLIVFAVHSVSHAQLPPPPPLQPGEHWSNLWSVSYDFQTNGSVRYLEQDANDPSQWCAVIMAQHDSNTAAGTGRYIYYSYSENNGVNWFSDVLNSTTAYGFPCITQSSGTIVIAGHQSNSVGSVVYQDIIFGGFAFSPVGNIPTIAGSQQPVWPHIAGTPNGNLVLAASPNDGSSYFGHRTTFNGSSWSSYVVMTIIGGPSGNFDVASGAGSKAAIVGTNYGNSNSFWYFESTDNGVSFGNQNLIMNFITEDGERLFANVEGGYQAIYDNAGILHVVFAAYKSLIITFPNTYTRAFVKPGIYHWSSLTNNITKIAAKSNIPELTDTITQSSVVPVGQPTITRTPSGKLLCLFTAYLRGNTQIVNNGDTVNAGEIFLSASDDNGASWSTPVNMTNTPGIEEKHPSLAPYSATETVGVYYLRDMKAGDWVNVAAWGKAPVYGIFNTFNFNSPPVAPALTSPPNNSSYITLTPLLDWQNSFSAESYNVQLASDSTFNTTLINQSTTASEYSVPASTLNYDSVYYWRVRSSNSFGTGAWSSVWKFRTTTFLPPAPALLLPENGAVDIPLTPTLWSSAPTASSYNLQLSSDSGFISTLINQTGLSATQYAVPVSLLSLNTTYYWRVSSTNSNGTGPWSAKFNFTTFNIPSAPELVSPANDSVGVPLVTLLNWNNVSNALRYRILVSLDSNFSSYVVNDSSLTNSQYQTPASLLNYSTRYFWKVNAIGIAGNGPYSDIWKFTTTMIPVLTAPVLVSPRNDSVGVPVVTLLNWNNVTNALRYRILVSVDSNFSSFIVNDSNLTNSQYLTSASILNYNTRYFWKVNALGIAGNGPYSDTWNFTTVLQSGLSLTGEQIPTEYKLFDNYPNPFNPSTNLEFGIPNLGFVSLKVYDALGNEVATLVNKSLPAGKYSFTFDGSGLSSGIYFYKLISGDFVETKRMVLLK